MIANLTDATFAREVEEDGPPYLVDFWASWCGRCRFLEPAVRALAEEYAGRLRVGKVDVEASPATAERFEVRGLPTVVLIDRGEVVARLEGVVGQTALRDAIRTHCGPGAPPTTPEGGA